MLKCPKCHKEIKYVVSRDNEILIVDAVLHTLITIKGNQITGYPLHKCDKKEC